MVQENLVIWVSYSFDGTSFFVTGFSLVCATRFNTRQGVSGATSTPDCTIYIHLIVFHHGVTKYATRVVLCSSKTKKCSTASPLFGNRVRATAMSRNACDLLGMLGDREGSWTSNRSAVYASLGS